MDTRISNNQFIDIFIKQCVCVLMNTTPQDESRHVNQELDANDIQQTLEGNNTAYARLVRRYEQAIASLMWRFTRDPNLLEELVQDVFVEAYLHLKSFRSQSPFYYWLRTIAYRCGYKYWKQLKRDRTLRENFNKSGIETSTKIETPSQAAEILFRLLETLPVEERLILTLHYFEELQMDEIAERMGWTKTLVKVRAHRARKKLKRKLEAFGLGQ